MWSDERIDEGVLQWFGHIERMKDRIAKRVYLGEWAGILSVGRPRKRRCRIGVNDGGL